MLELQVQVVRLWLAAADQIRAAAARARDDRDRGEVTATTALIVIMVIAAIAAATLIATRIRNNANNVPDAPTS